MKEEVRNQSTRVTVRNLQRKVPIDTTDLEKFAEKAAKICVRLPQKQPTDLEHLREVSVLIVSDRKIASLHRRFMHQSGPTDVITFQHGEIFISAETARRNAGRFGNDLGRELQVCIVHGLLHLHGYDDRDQARARKMESTQREILAQANRLK
jgi:probable rRNA maturation factor